MPTDDVSVEESPDVGQDATPEQAPRGESKGPSGEEIAAIMREAAATGNQPVLEALQQLQQTMTQQAQQQQQARQPEPSEDAEALLTNPRQWASNAINEWGKQQLAPILSRHFETMRDERIDGIGFEVDEKFGDGWFKENVQPHLDDVLRTVTIDRQADPVFIRSAISGIIGTMFMDDETSGKVEEAMNKAAKARQERDVATPPNMMGPGRSSGSRANVFSPEMRAALEGFQKAGVNISEADVKNAMAKDNTLSAWLPKGASK